MSINVIERKAIEILKELKKIKKKIERSSRSYANVREIDRIKNAIVKKIVRKEIPPEYITVESLSHGCQILEKDAKEVYNYLKAVELI